jgi:(R)-2-hydroxyacyl-CoA dehydratese activating ATPase
MFAAGCDVGSLTSKAVIMKDGKIIESVIIKSKARPWESADEVMGLVLSRAGLTMKDIKRCVGTGYGRDKISFIDEAISEIACHGKGARWLVPSVKTVIDVGGQDCKALRLDDKGNMMKFITNDKCASGTGRFLEVMAKVLNLNLDEMGEMSARSKQPITFASACTVWAQADVIQHLNDKVPIEDIAAGVNNAMASRMATLANSIGLEKDVCMTGGVAKNDGVVNALEKNLGIRIKRIRREDPQIAGAIGAALFAMEKARGGVL